MTRRHAVVGIHGIGNRQAGKTPAEAAEILAGRWSAALRRGFGVGPGVDAVVAYYAHHLAGETAQGAGDPAQLSEPEQEMLLRWASALGAPDEVAQCRLTQPARAAADWIARRYGLDQRVVRLLVTIFCREVHRYLSDSARRDAVRRTVADTIAATSAQGGARVVLAHSLGSVVVYEALWARPDLEVDAHHDGFPAGAARRRIRPTRAGADRREGAAPAGGAAVDQHRRPGRRHRRPCAGWPPTSRASTRT